jgi:hypothetical protein
MHTGPNRKRSLMGRTHAHPEAPPPHQTDVSHMSQKRHLWVKIEIAYGPHMPTSTATIGNPVAAAQLKGRPGRAVVSCVPDTRVLVCVRLQTAPPKPPSVTPPGLRSTVFVITHTQCHPRLPPRFALHSHGISLAAAHNCDGQYPTSQTHQPGCKRPSYHSKTKRKNAFRPHPLGPLA